MFDRIKKLIVVSAVLVFTFVCMQMPVSAATTADSHVPDKVRLDSLDKALPFVEDKAASTLLFGGSSPISFTGEARPKGMYHLFTRCPHYLGPRLRAEGASDSISGDRSTLFPSGGVRLGMVITPARNLALWSRLGFSPKYFGNRVRNFDTANAGFSPSQTHYQQQNAPIGIYEDMAAGIAFSVSPAIFWLRFGNIIWTEASPFTIWKAQPRAFAWEYLEYEEEQPVSEYYKSNVAEGEKTGRAAWNKKAFNGLNLESTNLPLGFYVNMLYAKFPDYDAFEREYMDFATDIGYAAEENDLNILESGIGDSYRHILHGRVAKTIGGLTLGLNYNSIIVSKDIIYAQNPYGIFFNSMFNMEYGGGNAMWATRYASDSTPLDCGKGYYKEPQNYSIDLKGNIGPDFTMHADIGFSRTDTNWIYGDTIRTTRENVPLTVQKTEKTSSDFIPALYANLGYTTKLLGIGADLAYIKRGFYAPFSFAAPIDAFFAFGSNCMGEGTFAAKSEASPYFQNMAGAQLSLSPKIKGSGHFKVKYGQHFQPESGRDLLFFPYRLHGMDLNNCIKSTYTMDGMGTIDFPMYGVKYNRRLGDESYDPMLDLNGESNDYAHIEESPDKGGLHADFYSMYESFVPYDDPRQVLLNIKSRRGIIYKARTVDTNIIQGTTLGTVRRDDGTDSVYSITPGSVISDENAFVPMHRKWTVNLELDAAYDIAPLIGYKNKFYCAGYAAVNGISTQMKPLAFSAQDADMLLWGLYLRFEPAIALTKTFYLDLLAGYETWQSEKSWMNIAVDPFGKEDLETPVIKKVPMKYKDVAYGIGFDWDALARCALHLRLKWFTHTDGNFPGNDFEAFLTSLEITTFF